MNQLLKVFILCICVYTISCASTKDSQDIQSDLTELQQKFKNDKLEEQPNPLGFIEKIFKFFQNEVSSTKSIKKPIESPMEERKTNSSSSRSKRQAAYDYMYNDFYPNDFLYDYYDWVCDEVECQLCNVLTSECCDPAVNTNCFLPDSCLNNPCLSGGTCVTTTTPSGNRPDFICVCLPGFTGKYCQLTNDYLWPLFNQDDFDPSNNVNNNNQGGYGGGYGQQQGGYGQQQGGYGQQQPSYGAAPSYGQQQPQPSYGAAPSYGQQQQQPSYGGYGAGQGAPAAQGQGRSLFVQQAPMPPMPMPQAIARQALPPPPQQQPTWGVPSQPPQQAAAPTWGAGVASPQARSVIPSQFPSQPTAGIRPLSATVQDFDGFNCDCQGKGYCAQVGSDDMENPEFFCICNDNTYGSRCDEGFKNPCIDSNLKARFAPIDRRIPGNYFIECRTDLPYIRKCEDGTRWSLKAGKCLRVKQQPTQQQMRSRLQQQQFQQV